MNAIYTAVLTPKESGNGYYCRVPDLPGCITTGTDLKNALDMITDAANLWAAGAEEDGRADIPQPTAFRDVPHGDDDILTMICVDTDSYRRKVDDRAVRKTVSMPAWMAYEAERKGLNCSQVLQEALRQRLG